MNKRADFIHTDFTISNTLGTKSKSSYGLCATMIDQIIVGQNFAKKIGLRFIAIGEGSNIISHAHVDALVCRIFLKGVKVLDETPSEILLEVSAGENWHNFVAHCTKKGWYGLENLSLIPGSVGAAPVQNIGAYGVEISTFIESVSFLDAAGDIQSLASSDCEFSYRESIFKQTSDKTIISVSLRLSKLPKVVIDYPELRDALARKANNTSPEELADAVIKLRSAKLPDPSSIPNAGSFFKNPVITHEQAQLLADKFPNLKMFDVAAGVKLSAAQLIDQAGWKGKQQNGVQCWPAQPLVITNSKNGSAVEVLQFAEAIKCDILQKYNVALVLEPYELVS